MGGLRKGGRGRGGWVKRGRRGWKGGDGITFLSSYNVTSLLCSGGGGR